MWSILFFIESILLGIGLAMDAFSVSLANGLNEPCMRKRKILAIAGVFAFFQFLMPLIGWSCVHTMAQLFAKFEKMIPWIALILLCFIGGKMLIEGVKKKDEDVCSCEPIAIAALTVQGIATSIDALSVGFTISEYGLWQALVACLLIGAVTFGICLGGVLLGRKVGTKLSNKASILGGVILIAIGIEIFLTGIF
ncbi:MAG: manganese efflux pump [Clostridia bacterium]|nr:manganese efflux pump [Clostridia bacterium]